VGDGWESIDVAVIVVEDESFDLKLSVKTKG